MRFLLFSILPAHSFSVKKFVYVFDAQSFAVMAVVRVIQNRKVVIPLFPIYCQQKMKCFFKNHAQEIFTFNKYMISDTYINQP